MPVVQDAGVVEEGAEVAARDVFLAWGQRGRQRLSRGHYHGKIYAAVVLECIEELNQPVALGRRQDVTLGENVPDFVELEEQLLAHDLQRAHLSRVLLLRKIHLAIAALADLGQDLEVVLAKSGPPLPQLCALASEPLGLGAFVLGSRCGDGVAVMELPRTGFALGDVVEKVKVVVKKVCQ